MRKILRFDVLAPLALSGARPLSYSLGVLYLTKTQGGEQILQAIALLGTFSIFDALMQGFARGRALHTHENAAPGKLWWVLALTLGLATFIASYILTMLPVALAYSTLAVNVALLRYEKITSATKFVRIFSGLELCVLAFATLMVLLLDRPSATTLIPLFVSAPLSRIFALAFTLGFQKPAAEKAVLPSAHRQPNQNTWVFVAATVSAQIVCALTSLLPIAICSLFNAESALPKCMLVVRWISTVGATASTLVNVFGARIFYGNMSGEHLKQAARGIILHQQKFLAPIFLTLAAVVVLPPTKSSSFAFATFTLVTIAISLANFLSSSFQALRMPTLSFWAQLHVFSMTAIAAFVAAELETPAIATLSIALPMTLLVYRRFNQFMRPLHNEHVAKS